MTSVIDAMYDDDDDVIETEEIETDDTDTDTDDTVADDDSDIDTDETETEETETDSEEDSPEGTDQIPEETGENPQSEKDVIPLATYIEMRRERNALKAQLEAAEKSVKQPEAAEEDNEDDDDELITTAQARKIAQEMAVQAREEAQAAVRQEMFRSRLDASEEAARAELTAVKCGEGLDYDTVIATGKGSLSREDQQAILQSANPGKTAYQLCLERNPALKRLASLEQAARVVKAEPVKKAKTKTDPPPLKEVKDNPDVLDYLFDE